MPRVARPSEATAFARSAYITDIIFFMLCAIPTVANSTLVKILPPQQSVLLVPYAGWPLGSRCLVSSRWSMQGLRPGRRGRLFAKEPMKGLRPGLLQDVRPGPDVIELHEIHLARQSSLQVPVGHIPVPGGIKLCSPGTFWVSNYLISNNGSCQVNFTKPNRANLRYTNSQWLREDATEASLGRVPVPKCR